MMRVRTVISTVIVLVMISVLALPMAEAQEATATSSMPVTCDSALVLLVGLAEQDFGYLPPAGLGPFEWGQFTDMFGNSSLTMPTQEPSALSTQEAGMSSSAMSTPEATMTVTLQAPVVLGEDPQCTQLRQDVVSFLTNQSSASNGVSNNLNSSSGNGTSGGMMSTELPGAPMATASAAG